VSCFVNRFWDRRLDCVAINAALQIEYILEFKWSTDRDDGFFELTAADTYEQHKFVNGALRATVPDEYINFVVVSCRSAGKSDFYAKLKMSDIQDGKKDRDRLLNMNIDFYVFTLILYLTVLLVFVDIYHFHNTYTYLQCIYRRTHTSTHI